MFYTFLKNLQQMSLDMRKPIFEDSEQGTCATQICLLSLTTQL